MKPPTRYETLSVVLARLLVLVVFASVAMAPRAGYAGPIGVLADPTPLLGSQSVGVGMPTGPSPDANNKLYGLKIFHFDALGALASTSIKVPDIPVTAGLPNPTPAQVSAASAAKAAAIVKAINAAKINGVTAAVDAKTFPGGMYPTGKTVKQNVVNRFGQVIGQVDVPEFAPADFTSYTVSGVRQSVLFGGTPGATLGGAVYLDPLGNRVTGEIGNGKFNFKIGGGGGSSSGGFQGSMNGTGPGTGLSTGLDALGFPSVVGFGFIDTSSALPVANIVGFDPSSGMTDADVLTILSLLFNEKFAPIGYSSTYDPLLDILSIDQPLSPDFAVWGGSSDTGIGVDLDTAAVPEPATLGLLAIGLVTGALWARRRKAFGLNRES